MNVSALKSTSVADIMTTELHKVTLKNSLHDVSLIFNKNKVRHVPVVKGEKLIGILSKTDLQRLSFGDNYEPDEYDHEGTISDLLTVEQVMNHKPVTVVVSDTVETVAEILTKAEFHALPVVENEKLVGIVTTTDIIRFLLSNS